MLDWFYQLLRLDLILWGVCLVLLSFVTTIKSFISKNHINQADRIRRSLFIGAAIALLAPAMALIAYGFSTERITFKTIFMIIFTSICFSPIGVAATLVTYYWLWGWSKLRDDILFLSSKINKKN